MFSGVGRYAAWRNALYNLCMSTPKQVKETKTEYDVQSKSAETEQISVPWAEIENADAPIVLQRDGEPLAVIVKYDEYLRLENARKEQATIPSDEIEQIVQLIAEKFNPEKIILFGSYAYGLPRQGSDVDLLVVMDTQQNVLDVALNMRLALPMRSFGLDLLVRTPAEIEHHLQIADQFITEIMKLGKVLYERKDSRVDRESGN